jgi:hypothetical protein
MEVLIQTDVNKVLKEGEVTEEHWFTINHSMDTELDIMHAKAKLHPEVMRVFDMQVEMYGIHFTEMRWAYYDDEGEELPLSSYIMENKYNVGFHETRMKNQEKIYGKRGKK